MKDTSELYKIVTSALRETIRQSTEQGLLEKFNIEPENADYLSTRVTVKAIDGGALDEMFDQLIKSWILSNIEKVSEILEEAK